MKEFIYFSYDSNSTNNLELTALTAHLEKLGYKYYVSTSCKGPFANSIKVQCALNEDKIFEHLDQSLFSGETKGMYPAVEKGNLSNSNVTDLLATTDVAQKNIEFEGTLSYLKEYDNFVVIQNDIEGFRKLFYYRSEGVLCVSSYMPLILVALKTKWRLKPDAFMRFFSSRECVWPQTLVDNICALEPKTKATFYKDKCTKHHFTLADNIQLKRKTVDAIGHDLLNIYKEQFQQAEADHNITVPLSGGFDSSSMLKCAVDAMDGRPHALSVGYHTKRLKDNNVYDETIYAEKIAKYYDVPFVKYVLEKEQFFDSFEKTLDIIDQPAFDPSSFCLMAGLAKERGYSALASGMGGDALFKSKLALKLFLKYFNGFNKLPKGVLKSAVKLLDTRGPLAYAIHMYDVNDKPIDNPFVVLDKSKISPFTKSFFKVEADELFNECRALQNDYWINVQNRSKTIFDIVYAYISLTNPDEYHAYLSAERQNITMMQPLVTVDSVLTLINASHYHPEINSRKYLTKLFGTNTDILYKGKSGLSIPYYDWAKGFADEVFEFWADSSIFKAFVDIDKLKELFEVNNESNSVNMLIWKLYVAKRYVEKYDISIN